MTAVGFVSRIDVCHAGHTQLTLKEMNHAMLAGMAPSKLIINDVPCELVAISHEHKTICVNMADTDLPRLQHDSAVFFDWQVGAKDGMPRTDCQAFTVDGVVK